MFNLIDRPLTPEELRNDYIETLGPEAVLKMEAELGYKIGE